MATPTPEELVTYLRTESQFEESLRKAIFDEVEWVVEQAENDGVFDTRPADDVVQTATLTLVEATLSSD